MIFQDPFASLDPRMTIGKIIEEPLVIHRIGSGNERREKVKKMLERVGLQPDYYNRYPHEFSGGQRQRVAIARALANEPPLILADEPTGNLDTASSVEIMELFTKLHQEGATVVLVTHEEDIAAFAHRVIRFSDGQIQSDKLNVARVVSGNGKGGEQDAD